jgi:DNA-binding CsgD family transcriptional regulator
MKLWERLTSRQQEICELLLKGHSNEEIANQVNITLHTLHMHFNRIYQRIPVAGEKREKRIRLAVALTYERHPELVPDDSLRAIVTDDADEGCYIFHSRTADAIESTNHTYSIIFYRSQKETDVSLSLHTRSADEREAVMQQSSVFKSEESRRLTLHNLPTAID